jgi:predicted lipid-binding transport protein (Tim44 family)
MRRHFLSILFLLFISMGLFMHDAQAGRFGGGRSFGISRSASSFSRSSFGPSSSAQNYSRSQAFGQAARQTASPMSRWLGPLAGFAIGGLIASLFMGHGLGSGILSWLLVGALIYGVILMFRLFRGQMQPRPQYYRPGNGNRPENAHRFAGYSANDFTQAQQAFSGSHQSSHGNKAYDNTYTSQDSYAYSAYSGASAAANNSYPLGFDAPAFLRDAKLQFIRLQAAYDQKNLSDIREFTSPQVFAEIQLQLQERGDAENKTHVISLEAELLDVENQAQFISGTEMQTMLATVRFKGMIQEDAQQPAAAVNEIWHFKKEVASARWIVAGVQQA